VEIQGVEMLPLLAGLCCVGFINPTGIGASETDTESSLPNVVF
jgi:hypothetical protein